MDIGHLNTDELDYELGIRGVHNVGTARTKIVTLRDILNKEAAGIESAPKDSSNYVEPEQEVQNCALVYRDVLQCVDSALESNSA